MTSSNTPDPSAAETQHSPLKIDIEYIGPAAQHNLLCWICNERYAVYHMSPIWCFGPCWECDAEISGTLTRKRKWLRR